MPCLVADEQALRVGYIGRDANAPDDLRVVVVSFVRPYAHMFGPPNDEALDGHPLWGRGLGFYGAFRVVDSSWIRGLVKMNSVHERHDPKVFERFEHYILTFHDSTLECVAEGFDFETHSADHSFALSIELAP